ncbi:MAG: NUDIX hydrolase [Flavobacteriaceae bacterium]|nr:NUDIX hydrolase [Flavobacteriaceae bacterium]|tara:strand:- start:1906 stop:2490 length:585 start_codon:yes stop_codon:yes gene_type:complete
MLQIFYKEKPIIISDNKTELKNSLIIDLELLDNIDIIKLLNKKNISSIGIFAENEISVISAFKKKFPEITAAGGKVINQNSETLFIFRNKKWDLPKGKAKKNEKITETALREVIEETGIKNISIIKPLGKTYHIFKKSGNHYLKSTYWFEMYSDYNGEFKPQKKEGITRVEWIGVENLQSVLPKSYANIRLLLG